MKENRSTDINDFSNKVGRKERRKLKTKRTGIKNAWFGLGMFGLIGWSVAVPSLVGAGLGLWIDRRTEGKYSWTLMLLITGLLIGCFNAWNWIKKENKQIQKEEEDQDE